MTPNSRDEPEPDPWAGLRRWAHLLGFGGHFLTKARRYSTTFAALRAARANYRRDELHEHQDHDHDPDRGPGRPGRATTRTTPS